MLKSLSIQNYALIEQAKVDFDPGFVVITGETGAGKSILLGALALILGKRADLKALLDKNKKCIVEGQFVSGNNNFKDLFAKYDLDFWKEYTIIRREINPEGKSRAFVNDTPVNLNVLQELGDLLVDVHSQNSMQALNDTSFQLEVIDAFAGAHSLSSEYRSEYLVLRNLTAELETLKEKDRKEKNDQDYYRFLFEEIESENLLAGEDNSLGDELKWLSNAVENKKILLETSEILGNEIEPVLGSMRDKLLGIAKYSEKFQSLANRIENNYIDLKDISSDLASEAENINFDPQRVTEIENRLDAINRLLHKHHLTSIADLLDLKDNLEQNLLIIDTLEEEIRKKEAEVTRQKKKVTDLAGKLSGMRMSVLSAFGEEVTSILAGLGMPKAVFEVKRETRDIPNRFGIDNISFMFNANNMGENREISKTASGGELSRLMLSIKSLVSGKNRFPTIILDEIDMGVSGQIADRVGELLKRLSENMQVIAITHLPQIAGKGESHLFVYKETSGEASKSRFRQLTPEERVEEIAKMLSGENVSMASIETAKHLIAKNNINH